MKCKSRVASRAFSEQGLTLIEILVVLIILGIVMTFLAGKILGAGDQAKADLTKIMMKDIQGKIEQFRLRYNAVPASLDGLLCRGVSAEGGCIPVATEEGLNDAWGNRFVYQLDGGGRAYKIKTFGADGRDGGDGVNFDFSVSGP